MAVAQPRLLIKNIASVFTLSANPSLVSTQTEANLLLPDRGLTARSTSLASQEIKGTCATAQTMSMFALAYTNCTQQQTGRLQLYSDVAWTTQVYDSGTAVAFPYTGFATEHVQADAEFRVFRNIALYFTELATVKSWKYTIADGAPANADGYFDIAGLYIGSYWQFANFPALSGPLGSIPTATTQMRMDDGALRANKGDNWARLELSQDKLDSTDWARLKHAVMRLGLDRDFWFSLYPGLGTHDEAYEQGPRMFIENSGWDRYNPIHQRTRFVMEGI